MPSLSLSLYSSIRCGQLISGSPRFCFAFSNFSTTSNRQLNNLITSRFFLYRIPLTSIINRGISTVHALTDSLFPFRNIRTLCPQKPLRSSSFLALTRFTADFFQPDIFSSNPFSSTLPRRTRGEWT